MRIRTLALAALVAAGCTPDKPSNGPPPPTVPPTPVAATVTLKGKTITVEYLRADPDRRYPAVRKDKLEDGHGRLCGWAHDRILHFFSYQTGANYDAAFLSADGRIVELAKLVDERQGDLEYIVGITSTKEARWALCLPEGWLAKNGAAVGDRVEFSKEILDAPPAATAELRIGGAVVRAECNPHDWERQRGLMHRRSMSADDGMLFIYPYERERKFWMGKCHFGLDIAYFDAKRNLLNVVSIDPYPDPYVDPGVDAPGGRAPSDGPALFALEVHKGWFRKKGLVDASGKPVRALTLEMPASVLKLVDEAE
jgi:hypothetical protein